MEDRDRIRAEIMSVDAVSAVWPSPTPIHPKAVETADALNIIINGEPGCKFNPDMPLFMFYSFSRIKNFANYVHLVMYNQLAFYLDDTLEKKPESMQ